MKILSARVFNEPMSLSSSTESHSTLTDYSKKFGTFVANEAGDRILEFGIDVLGWQVLYIMILDQLRRDVHWSSFDALQIKSCL